MMALRAPEPRFSIGPMSAMLRLTSPFRKANRKPFAMNCSEWLEPRSTTQLPAAFGRVYERHGAVDMREAAMIRSVVIALGLGLLASSTSAQPMGQNQPPNQWVSNCNYEKGKDCTVSAMIDGGPNNLLGTFLIVSYSVAYTTLTIVADGVGYLASMQVDNWQC